LKRVILLEDYYFWTRTKNERENIHYVDRICTARLNEATKNQREHQKGSDKETREI